MNRFFKFLTLTNIASFLFGTTIWFIILKFLGWVTFSWWAVFSPILIGLLFPLFLGLWILYQIIKYNLK